MYPILLLLTLLPSTSLFVDCRTACRKCREKNDLPKILEVYCAMCEVCNERSQRRLREKKKAFLRTDKNVVRTTTVPSLQPYLSYNPHHPVYPGYVQPMYPPVPIIQAIPENCLMSSLCNSSEDVSMKWKQELENEDTITNTTITRPSYPLFSWSQNLRLARPLIPVGPVYRRIINMPMMHYPFINMMESQSMPASASVDSTENKAEVPSIYTSPNAASSDPMLSESRLDTMPTLASTDTMHNVSLETTTVKSRNRTCLACRKRKNSTTTSVPSGTVAFL